MVRPWLYLRCFHQDGRNPALFPGDYEHTHLLKRACAHYWGSLVESRPLSRFNFYLEIAQLVCFLWAGSRKTPRLWCRNSLRDWTSKCFYSFPKRNSVFGWWRQKRKCVNNFLFLLYCNKAYCNNNNKIKTSKSKNNICSLNGSCRLLCNLWRIKNCLTSTYSTKAKVLYKFIVCIVRINLFSPY